VTDNLLLPALSAAVLLASFLRDHLREDPLKRRRTTSLAVALLSLNLLTVVATYLLREKADVELQAKEAQRAEGEVENQARLAAIARESASRLITRLDRLDARLVSMQPGTTARLRDAVHELRASAAELADSASGQARRLDPNVLFTTLTEWQGQVEELENHVLGIGQRVDGPSDTQGDIIDSPATNVISGQQDAPSVPAMGEQTESLNSPNPDPPAASSEYRQKNARGSFTVVGDPIPSNVAYEGPDDTSVDEEEQECRCDPEAISAVQEQVQDLQDRSRGALSCKGFKFLCENWISESEPCLSVSGAGGSLWNVKYKNGFKVYNCFRKCRGTDNVATYFLGLSAGDCDSWYEGADGVGIQVCYPREARELIRHNGPVIAVIRGSECR